MGYTREQLEANIEGRKVLGETIERIKKNEPARRRDWLVRIHKETMEQMENREKDMRKFFDIEARRKAQPKEKSGGATVGVLHGKKP